MSSPSKNNLGMDKSSLSNPNEALVTHLDWHAKISFKEQTVAATARYEVEILSPSAKYLDLDTAHLRIKSVLVNGKATSNYRLQPPIKGKPHLGQRLRVDLPSSSSDGTNSSLSPTGSTLKVTVGYETTSGCTALQWLPPSQTAGKQFPYLFSQCQAIHARSLVPCQDCPGVKMTYKASVTCPSWSTAIMSALSVEDENERRRGDNTSSASHDSATTNTTTHTSTHPSSPPEHTTYHFVQPVPIPSYLLALVVGDLEGRDLSPRVKIWSEPAVIEAAAWEFVDTEKFVSLAEDITDLPYQWKRYDVLCLPPSFPYGGMENPCLAFVTPTLLAGDRSLVDVIAHEIAHSWTGNLVTNATWEHFWLNEGWTRWLERKIMTARHNNNALVMHLSAISGTESLKGALNLMPEKFTSLVLHKMGDDDPDDSYSSVAYDKGFQFLWYLEKLVGEASFLTFFRAYLQQFKYKTVTSDQFKELFCQTFPKKSAEVDWETWLYGTGMPPVDPNFDDTLAKEAKELANEWLIVDQNQSIDSFVISSSVEKWTTDQTLCFLEQLLRSCEERSQPLSVSTVQAIAHKHGFQDTKNAEILLLFCQLAIAAGDESIIPKTVQFITTQGRMKFVRPLYRALYEAPMGRTIALKTFRENVDFYHPIAAKMIAKDLGVDFIGAGGSGSGGAGSGSGKANDALAKDKKVGCNPKKQRSTSCSMFNPAMVLCAGAVLVGYAYTRSSKKGSGGGNAR